MPASTSGACATTAAATTGSGMEDGENTSAISTLLACAIMSAHDNNCIGIAARRTGAGGCAILEAIRNSIPLAAPAGGGSRLREGKFVEMMPRTGRSVPARRA